MDKHAARLGDEIIHSSIFADITSIVAEGAVYAAMGAIVAGVATVAAPVLGIGALAAVGSSCLLSGIIAGAVANAVGITDDISAAADGIGDLLFPPSPAGVIISGSTNVIINGLSAARAAGALVPGDTPPPEEQSAGFFADYAGKLLAVADQFAGAMWQPTIASAAAGTMPLEQDKVLCEKHSGPQFIAEGSKSVFINGQPAARAKDRTTCGATISDDVSSNVIIGGETLTVRDIKSGKQPGLALAMIGLSLIRGRPGQILKNMPCALAMAGGGMLADMTINAVFSALHPVHAATGVKVLNDDAERDFSLPGRFPLHWQRSYNSLTQRAGLFGLGWSTVFDSYLTLEGNQAIWFDDNGRELRFALPGEKEVLYSISEGLMVRRNAHGDVAIADDDGAVWRLYKPTAKNPQLLRLASLSDEYGNALEMGWDEHGRLVRIHDEPLAIDVTLHYDDVRHAGRVTSASQFDGEQHWPLMQWTFDEQGQLASATDAAGIVTRRFRYNTEGLMVWHRLPSGLESEYRWQQLDHWRVVENRTNSGDGCHMKYDLDAGITRVSTYDGQQREHHWNAQGLITCFIDERGEQWRYEWDENELLTRRIDPLGHAVSFVYDDLGNRVEEKDADGASQAVQWLTHRALPTVVSAPDGATTKYYYDVHHGLERVVDALGQSTCYQRDEHGLVTEEIDAAGNSYRRDYNDAGQVIRETDCSGQTTRYRYHPLGWLSVVIAPNGEETRYHYDAAGRPQQLARAEGWEERLLWNDAGLPIAYESADGKRSEFRYDSLGRLIATRNAQGEEVQRRWDSRGRLTALQNENGESYQFEWGADSLLLAQIGLDGIATRYDYDAAGRAISRTFAAGHPQSITHHYTFSPSGQLTARMTPESQTRYHYSAAGLLAQVTQHLPLADNAWSREAEQEITFKYDALGRMVAEQGEQGSLAWQYDTLGNCTALTLPDGRRLKQLYYGSGHLLSIALDNLPVTEFTRDTLHRELSRSQGLLTTRSDYDRLGRLVRRDVFDGEAQRPAPRRWSRRRDFDYGNNLIREERDDNPFSQALWHYDSAGRLLAQEGAQPGNEMWRWDGAGNPLERNSATAVVHNRVTQLNGIRWQYDVHGRTSEKDNGQTRWRYRYDSEHRLTDVISEPRDRNKPQVQVSFRYDPLGRRISKTAQRLLHGKPSGKAETTRFVWDGFRLLQEIHDAVPLTYVYSDAQSYEPLARIDGRDSPEIFWFHNAANGMPERLTDIEGRTSWEGINSAWGKLLRETNQQLPGYEQNLRMQGQYLDRETGLHYNLFRYYDPDSARFTQPDPIGLAGGINLYQYAPNALGWVDPWGLSCKNVWNQFQSKSKGLFKSSSQASKAYGLWKKQDWAALEKSMGPGAWPPNRGFVKATPIILKPGTLIDRYGGFTKNGVFNDRGTFVSPAGASFESRALPMDTLNKPYKTYEVISPVHGDSGAAIPWFNQPGGGTQYELSKSISQLLSENKIKEI